MRLPLLRAATVLLAVLAAAPVSAQTADEIVARNIAAKGGESVLKSTTTVRTTGTGSVQGAQVTVTTSSKRPYFMRNEMALGEQKMIQGFDGETLWMSAAGMPAQALPKGPQTDALKQSSQIDSPLLDYKAKGTRIELGEPMAVDGKRLHHLVVTPKSGPVMHYYVDPDTHLEARMVMTVEDPQKMTMEMRFSDYKTVEGRTMPFTVTQFVNGNQVGQMKFEKVEFNVPLDDSIFRMPK
jgi:outer membrane lipoprotein-sorting protein